MSDIESSPAKTAKPAVKRVPTQHPSFADMVLDAVNSISDTKGVSVPGIRNFILEKYKAVDPNTMKYRLKQALTKLTEKEKIVKMKATEDRPLMSSRFRVNKTKPTKESKPKTKESKPKKPKKSTEEKTTKTKEDKPKVKKTTKSTENKSPKKKSITEEKVKKPVPKSPKTKAKKATEKPKQKVPKPAGKAKPKTPKKTKTAKKTGK